MAPQAASKDLAFEHHSPADRAKRGKDARKKMPRADHANWEPAAKRPDPIKQLLAQGKSRVQDLLPIRYGRMVATPFTFFRGAAAIMASDLASVPDTGLRAQLAGDAHLSNFGGFAAPDRSLIFDLNDFDETLPGPWEWDLKRLTASFVVAARDRGFRAKNRRTIVTTAVRSYRESMATFASQPNLTVWYARLDIEKAMAQWRARLGAKPLEFAAKRISKAPSKDSMKAFSKLTTMVDGEPRIVSDPPLIVPIDELFTAKEREGLRARLLGILRSYRRTLSYDRRHLIESYELVDVARKVVGVGSVGTRAWIALMLGRDGRDPLFLQFKEAQESVLAPYAGRSRFSNQGQRVVEGQRAMQAASDIFLGWDRILGEKNLERDFYVRQLWDGKVSAIIENMTPTSMALYAEICGWTLARAHARTGDRIAIASYLGKSNVFDKAMVTFSESYADQNEKDQAALRAQVKSGKIKAEEGI